MAIVLIRLSENRQSQLLEPLMSVYVLDECLRSRANCRSREHFRAPLNNPGGWPLGLRQH
jgi:hypothetical protein